MPVILPKDKENIWLDPSVEDKASLLPLLTPFDPGQMEAWEVSPRVNGPGCDSAENIRPI